MTSNRTSSPLVNNSHYLGITTCYRSEMLSANEYTLRCTCEGLRVSLKNESSDPSFFPNQIVINKSQKNNGAD